MSFRASRRSKSTASTNGDGFGLGWYGEHPEPGLYREVRPAWSDENLRYLCRHIHSHLYFAHVRASTGTPVTRPNCHPFVCGRWMFMHNGTIGNWPRIRRQVEALIPDELYGSRIGTTNSEAVFLALLGAGASKPDCRNHQYPGPAHRTGERRWHQGAAAVYSRSHQWRGPLRLPLLRKRQGQLPLLSGIGDNIVIVSEPLDGERAQWKPVPPGHMIAASAGGRIVLEPFLEAHKVAAE